MKKLIFLSLIGLFLISCGEKPIADFDYTEFGNYAPSKVFFNDYSMDGESVVWNFGDGETSYDQEPTHIYKNGGSYTVSLRVTNKQGESTITKTVVIKNTPTKLKITSLVLTAYPLTISTGGGWDSGDGPDIFPKIKNDINTYTYSTLKKENVITSQLPITYNVNFIFTNLTFKNQIDFYDYDDMLFDSTDDWMGGYYFTASNQIPTDGSKYPTMATFTSGSVKFTANFEWLP